ncbi:MAG: DNA-directed RNA polymerase subunit alpha [Candidatus Doudnabacteria bacterium]|nr:DNA-directed RNA polymerase subunit alpha [Candidatus Doudnabacteria bacterium]
MEALSLPNQARIEHLGNNKYAVTLEPLHPGYGVTIGNTLRRVLLSSMPGAAVTAVKIRFVDHEFSTVPNVKEDVVQIILNLKQLRLKCFSAEPVKLALKVKREGPVTAADITTNDQVEIINEDLHLATLDGKNAELDMELTVEQGRGYVPVEARESERHELGVLAVDAIFTPVRAVYFDVTNVRVGQWTNFEKLVMNLETDGTLSGNEAVDIAAHILVDHFSMLFGGPAALPTASVVGPVAEVADSVEEDSAEDADAVVEPSDLDTVSLSNRAKNALLKYGVTTAEQLRALPSEEVNTIPGLGKKTIAEIMMLLGRE